VYFFACLKSRHRRNRNSTKSPKPEHPDVEGKRGQHYAQKHQPRWNRHPALLLLILKRLLVLFLLLGLVIGFPPIRTFGFDFGNELYER